MSEPTPKTAKVYLAAPMTIDGRDYQPDDVVELPRDEDRTKKFPVARELVRTGRARWHEDDDPANQAPADAAPKTRRSRAAATAQEG